MYFQIIKAHPVQISSISHMREKWEAYPIRVCSNCSFRSVYFLRVSKVWSMWHPASVGRVQNKECYFMFPYNFLGFLLLLSFFFITKFLFLWFAFFLFIFFWLIAVLLLNWFLRISQFLHWYRELWPYTLCFCSFSVALFIVFSIKTFVFSWSFTILSRKCPGNIFRFF